MHQGRRWQRAYPLCTSRQQWTYLLKGCWRLHVSGAYNGTFVWQSVSTKLTPAGLPAATGLELMLARDKAGCRVGWQRDSDIVQCTTGYAAMPPVLITLLVQVIPTVLRMLYLGCL